MLGHEILVQYIGLYVPITQTIWLGFNLKCSANTFLGFISTKSSHVGYVSSVYIRK